MLRLRQEVRARQAVDQLIGPWPWSRAAAVAVAGNSRGLVGSPSWRHARAEWEATRAKVGSQVMHRGTEKAVVPVFVQAIAGHALTCRRCRVTGALDSATPGQWLAWALGHVRATRDVLDPVLSELRGRYRPHPVPRAQ